ncbi:MAG: AEC family transporter [Eubacteriaceae bacterium]|nr:AEC family transporter [Eubacteriaceae bacterium]
MNFYNVFISIFTLFAIGITGYLARKSNLIGREMADNIPKLITEITLPAMIISSMQLPFSQDRVEDIKLILLISVGGYLFQYIIAWFLPGMIGMAKSPDKGIYQFMMMFSNVSFMGFPVLAAIFGQVSVFYGAIYNLPFNLLVLTLGVYMIKGGREKLTVKDFLTPGLISTLAGLLFFFLRIELPVILMKPLVLLGDLTTPLSMLFIGASLSGIDIRNTLTKGRLFVVSLFRLVIIPIGLLLILRNFISDDLIRGIPVILNAMPVAAFCAILAKEYNSNVDLASEGIFLTTLFSMFTIPLIVWIYTVI